MHWSTVLELHWAQLRKLHWAQLRSSSMQGDIAEALKAIDAGTALTESEHKAGLAAVPHVRATPPDESAAAAVFTGVWPHADEAANNAAGSHGDACSAEGDTGGDRPGTLLDARMVAAAAPSLQEHPVIAAEEVAFATMLGEALPGMLLRRDSLVRLSRETQHQVGRNPALHFVLAAPQQVNRVLTQTSILRRRHSASEGSAGCWHCTHMSL